jgi:hypothetical protein
MRSLTFFHLPNPAALGRRVYSASNRNKYLKQDKEVSGMGGGGEEGEQSSAEG